MANTSLIQRIVEAEKVHLARQIAVLRSQPSCHYYAAHEIAGSLTMTTDARYGRKLNHTAGFGVYGPVTKDDLDSIVETYRSTGLPPELDMCAHADPTAFTLLTASSFSPAGDIDTFVRDLRDLDPAPDMGGGTVEVVETTDATTFIPASNAGFRSGGRSDELLGLLARIAVQRPDTTLFLAKIGNEVVGSAGMACLDLADGARFANLYIDSTLPGFRGKGIHAALLRARFAAARRAGCEQVMASARTGSVSARNIERAGLRKTFTSTTYTQPLQ